MNSTTWAIAGGVALILFAAWLSRRVFFRRTRQLPSERDLTIDISQLEAAGPPATGPQLELYGTPVRLAVLVLAPLGREGEIPTPARLGELFNELLPELKQVIDSHQPIFRRWPPQLSAQGFISAFGKNVRLPGDRGRHSPWLSLAGKFATRRAQYLVGLVCCAAQPNSYTATAVEHPGQWATLLRVRPAS